MPHFARRPTGQKPKSLADRATLSRNTQSDLEVELGLKSGSDLANKVRPRPIPDKASHDRLDVGQAFTSIVQDCVRQFQLNESLIGRKPNPEALHQARVAIRRLRAAFSLFQPAIRQGRLRKLRQDLKELVGPFDHARDLDVFLDNKGKYLTAPDRRKLLLAHSAAYEPVFDALNSQRSRELFTDLARWAASDKWRKHAASKPLEKFVAGRLEEMWDDVQRRSKRLQNPSERQLHGLRLRIKKLRYAADFMTPLYPKKRARKFVSLLARSQDSLGLLHDDSIGGEIACTLGLTLRGNVEVVDRSIELNRLATSLAQLKHLKPLWSESAQSRS